MLQIIICCITLVITFINYWIYIFYVSYLTEDVICRKNVENNCVNKLHK